MMYSEILDYHNVENGIDSSQAMDESTNGN